MLFFISRVVLREGFLVGFDLINFFRRDLNFFDIVIVDMGEYFLFFAYRRVILSLYR